MASRNYYLKPFWIIFWRMFRKQGWFILLIPLWFCGSSSFFYQEHLAEGVESLIDFLNKSYESINLITACFVIFIVGSCFGKEGHKPPYKLYYYPCSSFYLVSSLFLSLYLLYSAAITFYLLYMHYGWGYDLLTQRQIILMLGIYTTALSPYQYGKTPIILSLVSISAHYALFLMTPISPILLLVTFILTNYLLTVWAFSQSRSGMPSGDWYSLLNFPEIDKVVHKYIMPKKSLFSPLMSYELQDKLPANGLLLLAGTMIIIGLLPTITWWQIVFDVVFLVISLVVLSVIKSSNNGTINSSKKYSLPLSDESLFRAEIKAYFIRIFAMAIFIAGFFIIQAFSYNQLTWSANNIFSLSNEKQVYYFIYDYLLFNLLAVTLIGKTPFKILNITKNKTWQAMVLVFFFSAVNFACINTLNTIMLYRETNMYLDIGNSSFYLFILVILSLAWGLFKLFEQRILPLNKIYLLLGIIMSLSVFLALIIYSLLPSKLFATVCFISLAILYVFLSPLVTSPILVHKERHQ